MAKSKVEKWLTLDGLTLLKGWARDGLTDEQIAKNIGISRITLWEWKKKEPNILNALKKGKEVVDFEVENALLKRALGYRYQEVTKERVYNSDLKDYVVVVTKIVEKEVAPDTGAAMAWLKNRKKEAWRDKPIEQDKDDERVLIVNDLPKDS